MTRLLEGLTFTDVEQRSENQVDGNAMELLRQKEKENEEQKKEIEAVKRAMEELQKAQASGTRNAEVCLSFLRSNGQSFILCMFCDAGCAEVGHG